MTATDDAKAKSLVLDVLSDAVLPKINFSVGTWAIRSDFYSKVAEAIKIDQITVMVDLTPATNNIAAAYFPTLPIGEGKEIYDALVLRITSLGTTTSEKFRNAGTIIHECTHAGIDLFGWTPMLHAHHEVLAYIAEARGQWLKMESTGGRPDKVVFKVDLIRAAAWNCAADLAANGAVKKSSLVLLAAAISLHPDYTTKAFDAVNNDGVGKEWKL